MVFVASALWFPLCQQCAHGCWDGGMSEAETSPAFPHRAGTHGDVRGNSAEPVADVIDFPVQTQTLGLRKTKQKAKADAEWVGQL